MECIEEHMLWILYLKQCLADVSTFGGEAFHKIFVYQIIVLYILSIL